MGDELLLASVRLMMRTMPRALSERAALNLFLGVRHYPEPERERALRATGRSALVAGCHVTEFGPTGAPTVLLIHGWAGRGLQLSSYVEPLVAAGKQVVAMDAPHHGRNPGKRSAMPEWIASLKEAIATYPLEAIVGHSFGSHTSIFAANEVGWSGKILCLGGPASMEKVMDRFRAYIQAPPRNRDYFIRLGQQRTGVVWRDDSVNTAIQCQQFKGKLHAVVTKDDDDIPWTESRDLVAGGGGTVTVLEDAGHRGVMWKPEAMEAGLTFLLSP